MDMRQEKTSTDQFWDKRAIDLEDHDKVNIHDLPQRKCENYFLFKHLSENDEVLEVGCGNGFLTKDIRGVVKSVFGFDFSSNMVAEAKRIYSEKNNTFAVGSVLNANVVDRKFSKVVCVRVLINLANLNEQRQAIKNMKSWVEASGKVVLIEGFQDGFESLNVLRGKCGLSEIKPAKINFYSKQSELEEEIHKHFIVEETWHSGAFDVLTRVVNPLLVGEESATGPSEFHEKILPLAVSLNNEVLQEYGRLKGYLLSPR